MPFVWLSFSVNHYGTSYATGTILEADSNLDLWTMDEVEKSWTRDGASIGKRGHNGHPHTGELADLRSFSELMENLFSSLGLQKSPCLLLG